MCFFCADYPAEGMFFCQSFDGKPLNGEKTAIQDYEEENV